MSRPGAAGTYAQVADLRIRVEKFSPFEESLAFFNETLGRPVCIAGGAVRDLWMVGPGLIKDYDVWVLGVEKSEIADLDSKLDAETKRLFDIHTPEEMPSNITYPNRQFHSPKANLMLPWCEGKYTQVMYTPCKTMRELVAQFDWHACSFGYDGETVIHDGVSDFYSQTLTLNPENALRSPRSTLRRGFHLEDKFRGTPYRLKMLNETILSLAAMLTLSNGS